VNRARLLRKKATEVERILWRHLRNRNFAGYKFRRQHPLDCYILDFYCPAAKLAIELDGGGHNYRAGQVRDRTRSELLARRGIIVLRFWNHQVRQELDSVLQAIWFALQERCQDKPSPNPLPLAKGRGDHYTHTLYPSEVITLRHMFAVRSPIAKNVAKNFTRNLMLGYEDNLRGTGIRK
jgi:very-short-patch-repair endonuclease